jgi:Fe-S-cluster-containing hydrogenase component 2
MEKIIFANIDTCRGCGICELICSFVHYGEYNPKKSFIKVLRNLEMGTFVPIIGAKCDLCSGEEKCVRWCPYSALESYDLQRAALLRKSIKVGKFPIIFGSKI